MIKYKIIDNLTTFDLWIKDTKKPIFAVHIEFERGKEYDVTPDFIKDWCLTQGLKFTIEEAQKLSDELTQHLKQLNEKEACDDE